ncbi:MAG: hypothetical protein PUB09_05550 [Firmicutes bacterium]|nr:hypothetical protein [Bacillota bacterium]
MRKVWMSIDKLDWKVRNKNTLFIWILILISSVCGGLTWAALGRFVLPETIWILCFMGYPAVFVGVFGGVLYLWRHDFS